MSDQTTPTPANPTVDPYKYLQIVRNLNGTITRLHKFPDTAATPDPNHPSPVLSKDILLNQSNNTWLRIFLPRQALDHASSPCNNLPLIVYFHGGGFILLSASSSLNHDFCVNMASEIHVVIVSVEYRLAPEFRLPAAYDDAVEALHLIKTAPDEWLREYADLANCFLMGSSAGPFAWFMPAWVEPSIIYAWFNPSMTIDKWSKEEFNGGNMAYQVGLRAVAAVHDLEPIKIQGLILHQPFFGGSRRTGSELRLVNDLVLPLSAADLMWELGLPIGVDRDHEYCNPTVGGGSQLIERMRLLRWRIIMMGCNGDPLIDRQIEVVKMLEGKGVDVVSELSEGGFHGEDAFEPSKRKALCVALKQFILSSVNA